MIPIDIWVVEDEAVYRRALKELLESEEHITCSRVFPSGVEFFEAVAKENHPDLVLMDLGLPGMGGIDCIEKLATVAPDVTVMVLTVFKDKEKVLRAVEAGAAGYLLKTASGPEILKAVQEVFLGGSALSPSVARVVMQELRKPAPEDDFDLTPREIGVLEQLARGLSVKEIGTELDVSRRTVAFHLENIYGKLKVQSQSGAVAKALRAGIV